MDHSPGPAIELENIIERRLKRLYRLDMRKRAGNAPADRKKTAVEMKTFINNWPVTDKIT